MESVKTTGLNVIEHSGCNNCGKDQGWQWMRGRTAPTKICWDIELETRDGTNVTLPFLCETIGVFEEQNCKIDTSRSKIKDVAGKLNFAWM